MIEIAPLLRGGVVRVPPSKSASVRALLADGLAGGGSRLHGLSVCQDALSAKKLAQGLLQRHSDSPLGKPSTSTLSNLLDCGESALSLHLAAAIAALQPFPTGFTARGSLLSRPLVSLCRALSAFGVQTGPPEAGFPFTVKGPLRPARVQMDGRSGSQALSGLLMALPLLEGASEILLEQPTSLPYIFMTIDLLQAFGIEILVENEGPNYRYVIPGKQRYYPAEMQIPGDWSAGALWLVAAAIRKCTRSHGASLPELYVDGLDAPGPSAPDSMILDVLQSVGLACQQEPSGWTVQPGSVLRPLHFDLRQAPDLAPPLAALAAYLPGRSQLSGIHRLFGKESNRALALQEMLERMGIRIALEEDRLWIEGGFEKEGPPCYVDACGDHRIAMALAVAATGMQRRVVLEGEDCVAKSYPEFWKTFQGLANPRSLV